MSRIARAQEYHSEFITQFKNKIPYLIWDRSEETQKPPIRSDKKGHYYVRLHARYKKKDSILLYNDKVISSGLTESISIDVPIQSEHQSFTLVEIQPNGEVEAQRLEVHFPQWHTFIKEIGTKRAPKKLQITFGVGLASISYQQKGLESLSELVLTPQLLASYTLNKLWNLEGSTFVTAPPLMTSPADLRIQFFGADISLVYKIPSLGSWHLKAAGGYFYTSTLTSTEGFGYRNVQGPQITFNLTKTFENGSFLSAYFKYNSVFSENLIDFNNIEAIAGCSYVFAPFNNGSAISLLLDISRLNLSYQQIQIQSNSYMFGLGYKL